MSRKKIQLCPEKIGLNGKRAIIKWHLSKEAGLQRSARCPSHWAGKRRWSSSSWWWPLRKAPRRPLEALRTCWKMISVVDAGRQTAQATLSRTVESFSNLSWIALQLQDAPCQGEHNGLHKGELLDLCTSSKHWVICLDFQATFSRFLQVLGKNDTLWCYQHATVVEERPWN